MEPATEGIVTPFYRYAWDRTRAFTEAAWLERAWKGFIRLDDDTDESFGYFLIGIFEGHLRARTIILAEDEEGEVDRPCPFISNRFRDIRNFGTRSDYPLANRSATSAYFWWADKIIKQDARKARTDE